MQAVKPSITVHLGNLPGIDRTVLETDFSGFQELFFDEFGIIIPIIEMMEDDSLQDNVIQLYVNGQPQPVTEIIQEGEFWLYVSSDQLDEPYFDRYWEARSSVEPNSGNEAAIVRGSDADMQLWKDAGHYTRSPQEYVVFCIAAQIHNQPEAFINHDLINYYLNQLKEKYPDLVMVTDDLIDRDTLIAALNDQLAAGNSIKNLPRLLDELLEKQIYDIYQQ